MRYLRLYASADGESHLEELQAEYAPVTYAPPAPAFDVSEPVAAARHVMVRFPVGWDSVLHPVPRRQLFVMLSGQFECGISDGTTTILTAGDMVLMEDTTGFGHTAKVVGATEVLGLMVHLE